MQPTTQAEKAVKVLDILMLKIATASQGLADTPGLSSDFQFSNMVSVKMLANMNAAKDAIKADEDGTKSLQNSILDAAKDIAAGYHAVKDNEAEDVLDNFEKYTNDTAGSVMLAVNFECEHYIKNQGKNAMAKKPNPPKVIRTSAATEGGSSVTVRRPA